jgi:hypothetical protein
MEPSQVYRGLLFALRENLPEGDLRIPLGRHFHAAFDSMREYARENTQEIPVRERGTIFDPLFGLRVIDMLIVGDHHHIINLPSPRYRHFAVFLISKKEATKKLDKFPFADTCRKLAAHLYKELMGSACTVRAGVGETDTHFRLPKEEGTSDAPNSVKEK